MSRVLKDETTLAGWGSAQLSRLATACGLEDRASELEALFLDLLGKYGDTSRSIPPQWRSNVCDDYTPFEYSIAIDQTALDFRLLVESVGAEPTMRSAQEEAEKATERLAASLGVTSERLRRVASLFRSEDPQGLFSRWHAVEFGRGRSTSAKVYLNPLVHGDDDGAPVVEKALLELGMAEVWDAVCVARKRGRLDEVKYFSLDLADSSVARVKVYLRHHDILPREWEESLSGCNGYEEGVVSRFCEAMTGEAECLAARPVFSCLAAVSDQPGVTSTAYIPMSAFAPNDAVARTRTTQYLESLSIPSAPFEECLSALTTRPLESSSGLISYVSTKVRAKSPRVTIYLSPESYSVAPPQGQKAVNP